MSLLFKGKGRVQEGEEVRHQTEDSNPGVGRRAMSQTETGINWSMTFYCICNYV